MKKALTTIGGFFLVLVLAGACFFGYAAFQGRKLDASSKAYVEANVPAIISTWSKDELLKRSSVQLLSVVVERPEHLDLLFQKLSRLGAMRSLGDVKGGSNMYYSPQEGKVITASYVTTARCEGGEAQIAIRLIQIDGQWQILNFHVESPIFLQ